MGYLMNALHLKLVLLFCTVAAQTRPGCNDMCGNVSIPYPFGTSKKCYINESFFINCTTTPSSAQPIAYLRKGNITVLNISLDPPELIISPEISKNCYYSGPISWSSTQLSKFSISNTRNRFTVVGCDTYAHISDLSSTFTTGCSLSCSNETRFEEGACSGVGCCETSFPEAIRNYSITLRSFNNYTYVRDFNPCGYAFLAQNGSFNFSSVQDLLNLSNTQRFPVVVDWVVANLTCREAEKDPNFACRENSRCQNSTTGIGYYCVCKEGFRGNPYLSHPDEGCKDINECEEKNRCSRICHNFEGHFKCSCPWGYRGDGYIDGSGCKFPIIEISLGISVGLLVIFTLVSALCWRNKQKALKQLREQYFEQNGGNYMLQQIHQQ